MGNSRWIRLCVLLLLIVLAAGCNLSRNPPTPTLRPTITLPVPVQPALTLMPSVTPISLTPVGPGAGGTGGACPPPSGWVAYVIVAGDTLGDLAEATGTTVDALVRANCLADASRINVGQTIYLPVDPVVG
jgi:hypothetical protein